MTVRVVDERDATYLPGPMVVAPPPEKPQHDNPDRAGEANQAKENNQ